MKDWMEDWGHVLHGMYRVLGFLIRLAIFMPLFFAVHLLWIVVAFPIIIVTLNHWTLVQRSLVWSLGVGLLFVGEGWRSMHCEARGLWGDLAAQMELR